MRTWQTGHVRPERIGRRQFSIDALAQVRQIADKARVVVESSTNPHSNGAEPHAHPVTFN